VAEAQAMRECMAGAGYPDYDAPPLDAGSSLGEVIPLSGVVDAMVAEAASTPVATGSGVYADERGLTGQALTTYSNAFMACDDERAQNRMSGETDSERGAGQKVLSEALAELHGSAEYRTALADYVACMRADGWQVQDNGSAAGVVTEAVYAAVLVQSPVRDAGTFGIAGATLDPDLVEVARQKQDALVASDATCGRDTLDPLYVPFNQTYGALIAALTGVRPDAENRVRL